MQFTATTKMADMIHHNFLLLPVLERFNIQLGFGDKSVREVCDSAGINTDFFLVIVNSFHDPDYFPQGILLKFPLSLIIDYIKKSHEYYIETKIPQVEALIISLCSKVEAGHKKKVDLINRFFSEYKHELTEHIDDEEKNVIPYIKLLEDEKMRKHNRDELIKLIRERTIEIYAEKHSNLEEKLYDLKNILIKYLPPVVDRITANDLLVELFRLESDLNDHARIEDKVMIPKVRMLEKEILGI